MKSWKDGPHTPAAVGLSQAANDPAGSLGCFTPWNSTRANQTCEDHATNTATKSAWSLFWLLF